MNVVIVIPTYNEADNIPRIVPLLAEEVGSISPHTVNVLFVDSSSPDGTAGVIREWQKKYPFIHLITEPTKTGLGTAFTLGYRHAMQHMSADVLMDMDADLQHNPRDIHRLLEAIDQGYDYVVGSRFTCGGSIPGDWAFKRKFLSIGGNLFSKVVLLMPGFNDFTSGFRAARVKGFMDSIDFDSILSTDFAYKIDLLFRLKNMGAKLKEVPIAFGLRDRGDSKMEKNNFRDSLRVVLSIRYRESKSFLKFILVGFIGLGSDLLVFNLLRASVLSSKPASLVSGFLAMLVTFLINNFWSFSHKKIRSARRMVKSIVIYYFFSYLPIIFRGWLIGFSISKLSDTALVANTAFLAGIGIGLIWNYTVYSKIIWRKGQNDA